MDLELTYPMTERNNEISKAVEKEQKRLFGFIRKRVNSDEDAQDILQDVFYQFVEVYRGLEKIERTSSWLYRVARNKIIDRYRKKKETSVQDQFGGNNNEGLYLEELIPLINTDTPEDAFTRELVMEAVDEGLDELPLGQKEVFVLHEIEGKSFNEISEELGVKVNTLITRKRYAVLHLREKLEELFNEIKSV